MVKRLATDPCRVEGCDRPLLKVTTRYKDKVYITHDYLCAAHRTRWTRHRSLTLPGYKVQRKPDDQLIFPYRRVSIAGKTYRRNRVVWAEAHACPVPPGHHVHHTDENRLNDTPENLQALPAREHNRMPHGAAR